MDKAKEDREICICDEKNTFFSRLLTKEEKGSMGHSSRVYYCTQQGSVPFQWEEEPGKPKTVAKTEEDEEGRNVDPAISLPPQVLRSPGDNIRRLSSSASIVRKKNGIVPLFRFMKVQCLATSQTSQQQECSVDYSFRRSASCYNEINTKAKEDKSMLVGSTLMGCAPFNVNKVHCPIPRPSSRSRHNKLRSPTP